MNHLLRELAPLSETGWKEVDGEAKERLTQHLAARRLVDVEGPHGWEHSATNIGRVRALDAPPDGPPDDGVRLRQRRVLALNEIRVPFTVSRDELDDAERGASDLEFDDLDRAARQVALIENRAVCHGWSAAGITGIAEASPYPPLTLGEDATAYPHVVAQAVHKLREAGIGGPYALAVCESAYTRIVETTERAGLLVFDHLRRVLDGGRVLRTPGIDGAVVVSLATGNYTLELGQDLSIGYTGHDEEKVSLYLEESFTFKVNEPDAAIALDE